MIVLLRLKETCFRAFGPIRSGTAYLIADGRLATAYHVVKPLQEGQECEILMGRGQFPKLAKVLRVDKMADVAILEIGAAAVGSPLSLPHGVGTYNNGGAVHSSRWQSFGFPEIANLEKASTDVSNKGIETKNFTGIPLDG